MITYGVKQRRGALRFDRACGRFVLDGLELHCGDTFEVNTGAGWVQTRIEHASSCGWFLIGLPGLTGNSLEGIDARRGDF